MTDLPAPRPVAYLTGHYPKASHTFIQREIAGVEAAGVSVLPCSIRRPAPAELIGPEERAESARTFYVLAEAQARPLHLAGAHLALLAAAPRRYLGALALAWRMRAPGLRAALWQLFYLAEAGGLARHLQARGAGRIHNHFAGGSAAVALLAGRLTGLPVSLTLHGPADFLDPAGTALGLKIERAAFVACISHFARSQAMMATDPAHWDKLHIVRCGVVPERYDVTRPAAGPGRRLLFVGRLAAVKGLPVLFEALARLRPDHPDVSLTLIGDGPDRAALEAQAQALGLAGHVAFLGYRSQAEVAEQLARTDVFVLPSFAEGVPVVLMEAMAAGVPVVATRVAGVGELVEDGTGGFIVPPGDAGSLADRIGRLLDAPERRAEMGAAGRARVQADFDVRREAARLATLFRDAAADAGADPVRRTGTAASRPPFQHEDIPR